MNLKNFFRQLWVAVLAVFGKHLPKGYAGILDWIIGGLNKTKTWTDSQGAITVESVFGDDGKVGLAKLRQLINDLIPTLEIAKGLDVNSLPTDPIERADAILRFVVNNINNLPEDMKGKHWEDVARKIIEVLLSVSTTAAKAIINTFIGKLKTA